MSESIPEGYDKVYNQAIKYLGVRSHTVFEIHTKLTRKKFDKKLIEEVISDLQQRKYLNDRDFAQVFAQNLVKYKTFGYYGIKNKLKQRGVEDSVAEDVLSEELDAAQETKLAHKAVGKSLKKDKIKLMQMLQRKGFRMQAINSVVGDYDEE